MPKRYWENFKEVREAQGLSQEEVARRLGLTRQGNLPQRENHSTRIPKESSVRKHAKALECDTSRLFVDVEFPYDKLRGLTDKSVSDKGTQSPQPATDTQAQLLLQRYEREQARMASAHPADRLARVANDLLEVGKELRTWRPSSMARRSGSGVSPRNRKDGSQSRRRPAAKATDK